MLRLEVEALQNKLDDAAFQPEYQLIDIGREGKLVGILDTARDISKGDRVFLGEDMYDVQHVKVMAVPFPPNQEPPQFLVNRVQLLVTFEGKGKESTAK